MKEGITPGEDKWLFLFLTNSQMVLPLRVLDVYPQVYCWNRLDLCAGAFPEVRQAQFPLGMGKGENKSLGTLAASVGANGQVNYDSVLKQSKLSDKIITSGHSALVPKLDDINNNVSLSSHSIMICSESDL